MLPQNSSTTLCPRGIQGDTFWSAKRLSVFIHSFRVHQSRISSPNSESCGMSTSIEMGPKLTTQPLKKLVCWNNGRYYTIAMWPATSESHHVWRCERAQSLAHYNAALLSILCKIQAVQNGDFSHLEADLAPSLQLCSKFVSTSLFDPAQRVGISGRKKDKKIPGHL